MHFFIFSKTASVRLQTWFMPGWWELKLCHLGVLRPKAVQRFQVTYGAQAPADGPLGAMLALRTAEAPLSRSAAGRPLELRFEVQESCTLSLAGELVGSRTCSPLLAVPPLYLSG